MSRRGWVLLTGVVLVAGTIVGLSWRNDEKDAGEFSAYTRAELSDVRKNASRFPVVVPVTLPAGAGVGDEPGFSLISVSTDPRYRPARRVWVSFYIAEVLGGPGASFRVFQRPGDVLTTRPCGATDQPFLKRTVGDAVLTICSRELLPGSKARDYWKRVELSTQLDEVEWLRG